MTPTSTIIVLWFAFAGSHLALSSTGIRGALVATLGEWPFRGLYSVIALALFVPLVDVYFAHKHAGPWLWMLPHTPALLAIVYVGTALAFVLAVAGLVQPSPAFVVPGAAEPRGVHLITRHPILMSFALLGLVHLLPNGSTADVAFFGGFVLFSLVGAAHQDRRKLASGTPGFREFYEATPFLPFTGGSTLRGIRQVPVTAVAVGLLVTIGVRYFHSSWFGG